MFCRSVKLHAWSPRSGKFFVYRGLVYGGFVLSAGIGTNGLRVGVRAAHHKDKNFCHPCGMAATRC